MQKVQKSIDIIQSKGFKALKIEMEINGDRVDRQKVLRDFRMYMDKDLPKVKRYYCVETGDLTARVEITLTIAVKDIDKLHTILELFTKAYRLQSSTISYNGVGLHLSILTDTNSHASNLDTKKLRNFKKSMDTLLMALWVLSTSDTRTRGFIYAKPAISDKQKYSFIYTHYKQYLEYRVFETCYKNPHYIYNYIKTIAKTLKYYADKNVKTKLTADTPTTFMVHSSGRNQIKDLLQTKLAVARLRKELGHFINNKQDFNDYISKYTNQLKKVGLK
jgi:hypothetical protein